MTPQLKKKLLIGLGIVGVAIWIWRAPHRKPWTVEQAKEFEDSENMFPEPAKDLHP